MTTNIITSCLREVATNCCVGERCSCAGHTFWRERSSSKRKRRRPQLPTTFTLGPRGPLTCFRCYYFLSATDNSAALLLCCSSSFSLLGSSTSSVAGWKRAARAHVCAADRERALSHSFSPTSLLLLLLFVAIFFNFCCVSHTKTRREIKRRRRPETSPRLGCWPPDLLRVDVIAQDLHRSGKKLVWKKQQRSASCDFHRKLICF